MIENNSGGIEPEFFDLGTWEITAVCHYCNRKEDFEDEMTAQAWMTGHIFEEHSDKLPNFSNTDS